MNNPISNHQDYIEYLAFKGVVCPRCHMITHDEADVKWIEEFKECLLCDHVHNEEIESQS